MAKKKKNEERNVAPLEQYHYFATPIYITKQPQFLEVMREVSLENINKICANKRPDKIYPIKMSGSLLEDERAKEFAEFVAKSAWDILVSQGYAMDGLSTIFTELWCQEHYQTSSMEYHNHPGGNFIVGFYFLDTPENCPPAIIHDPRPSRMMLSLPEANPSEATLASTMINFKPEPGMMMFAPAWLAHSFARNPSKDPFRFVHFNLSVQPTINLLQAPDVEVI